MDKESAVIMAVGLIALVLVVAVVIPDGGARIAGRRTTNDDSPNAHPNNQRGGGVS